MGYVILNSIKPDLSANDYWVAQYFADFPVSISAFANDGYEFAGWK